MNITRRARRGLAGFACGIGFGLGLAAAFPALAEDLSSIEVPPRFKRPAADTDEGGLWGLMDREEARMKRSPLTIKDKELQDYLRGVVCRLSESHCPDIRVLPVRTPHFNAMMGPNGVMLVWSGLLLRVDNEAQLAAIMGHEMGHYLERHTVEQLRAAKDTAVVSTMVGMIGGVGTFLGQIGLAANLFAFSREHEARADRMGMRLMRFAGYDGREAAVVWEHLLDEMKVTGGKDAGKTGDIFDTHPVTAGRRDELKELAGSVGGDVGEDRFRKAIAPLRFGWIQDEIKRGQFEESLVLFNRMLRKDPQDAEVLYARGEIYRLRDDTGDAARALADLQGASRMDKAPAETFRSLGLAYQQHQDKPAAAQAFTTYLAKAPQAADAALVRGYLAELQ